MTINGWTPILVAVINGLIAAAGFYKAWMAEKHAKDAAEKASATAAEVKVVSVQIDGLLVARDAAERAKGEAVGVKAGEEKAETLAEGQRQGREQATAPSGTVMEGTGSPIPVTDKRATDAAVRSAKALERAAETQEKVADKNKKKEV